MQPAAAGATPSRRDFIKLMGLVSAAALLSVAGVAIQKEDTLASETTAQDTDGQSLPESDSDATCMVRCNRRCSFPGHCNRYTDSNGNGRCDLGECM